MCNYKKDFVRLDVSIPQALKERLIACSKEIGLNLTSTVILILNENL